jgi:hypothetical protein
MGVHAAALEFRNVCCYVLSTFCFSCCRYSEKEISIASCFAKSYLLELPSCLDTFASWIFPWWRQHIRVQRNKDAAAIGSCSIVFTKSLSPFHIE